jgi:hypothetical protein
MIFFNRSYLHKGQGSLYDFKKIDNPFDFIKSYLFYNNFLINFWIISFKILLANNEICNVDIEGHLPI